ncbi:MAG: cyclic nucleotide-binding domain-containing protein [Moraxellaceae bacterium]|nr:cyclic nucleotide-binding domain-containing protein [Pseudomonadales bacterium]MCP5173529.1 cyclic nucleotide-binding domain-containing protein [Moraxellaceae bacterium]MCP5177808.1 cyclic nucleotide-binding domain-containing protein [Moraxellaceae bacterium]HQV22418.1 cyclic nucleotide-binding domain-containing protein [Agitococcus sp.]
MDKQSLSLLQAMPIFGGVEESALELLLQYCPQVHVDTDCYFFKEGDSANSLFILKEGKVVVLKDERIKLQYLSAGDCFGEMALIDLNPRSASVLAVEDCVALEISYQTLYILYEQYLPQFTLIQMNLARELSRRLRALDERLSNLDKELLKLINVL